jgi:hypothetical protein
VPLPEVVAVLVPNPIWKPITRNPEIWDLSCHPCMSKSTALCKQLHAQRELEVMRLECLLVISAWITSESATPKKCGPPSGDGPQDMRQAGLYEGCGWNNAMVAPVGSVRTVAQPTFGISIGPLDTVAPSDFAFSVEALMSSTPT